MPFGANVGKALPDAQCDKVLGLIPADVPGLQAWASSAAAYFIAGPGAERITPEQNGLARG
jgi:hypothetical protein